MAKNKDFNNMVCLDLYLSQMSDDDYQKITHRIFSKRSYFPLINWDLVQTHLSKKVDTNNADFVKLNELAAQFQWDVDIEKILMQKYEAIVVTDLTQTIYWVNDRFESMTGYPTDYAIGKKPSFLQGQNTSAEKKAAIRKKIVSGKTFKETIINYRKNKEEYLCEVTILPIKDKNNNHTHFLALERALS